MSIPNKIAIYTAVMGGFDKVPDPKFILPNVDYIFFTDNLKFKSDIWKVIYVQNDLNSARKKAREIKILSHKYLEEYDYTLWVDGNVRFLDDISSLLEDFISDPEFKIATFKHPDRICIYEEFIICASYGSDKLENLNKQLKVCIDANYPTNNGLCETNVIFRKNKDYTVQLAMENWFGYIDNTIRDQLSFNFVMHVNKIKYHFISGNARGDSELFFCEKHNEGYLKIFLKSLRNIFLNLK